MKKIIFLTFIAILIFTVSIFGQQKRKKVVRALPEVGDEVLVNIRKKQVKPKVSARKKITKRKAKPFFDEADAIFGKRPKAHDKYANQEVGYRKKSTPKKKRSITHDPEFENWANRKRKITKTRRTNK